MCLGLATGYRKPTENKERTYADLKQTHFPENKIDAELTNDDFLKALEYVKEYEQAIKEEQDFLKNGDEFHIEALKVCEIVKQALEKRYDEGRDIALHSKLIATARTEAIKEFAYELKIKIGFTQFIKNAWLIEIIDNLVKKWQEMCYENANYYKRSYTNDSLYLCNHCRDIFSKS